MAAYLGDIWLTRLVLERGMAAIYLVALLLALWALNPLDSLRDV